MHWRATRPRQHSRAQRLRAPRRHEWWVYTKTPLAGPAAALAQAVKAERLTTARKLPGGSVQRAHTPRSTGWLRPPLETQNLN